MSFQQSGDLQKNRYRLYREHKYIFFVFSELLQFVSSLNLEVKGSIERLKNELKKIDMLLAAHAEYEESRIHSILKTKQSPLLGEVDTQHQDQKLFLEKINEKIKLIEVSATREDISFLGYELYLDLRNLFCRHLNHFDYEERVIMPELQRLLHDDEIKEIDRISYRQMLPEQMVHMMEVLFPHMNGEDKFTFLNDIKYCEPDKFEFAWRGIYPFIEENERNMLINRLSMNEQDRALDFLQNFSEEAKKNVHLYYPWENQPDGDCALMMDYHKNS